MAIELNHTIVPAHDPQASAQFLADILGLPVDPPVAHFTPVTLANGVSLDFDHYDHVDEHHYAFQLSDEEFQAAFGRIRDRGITYYADPACRQPGQVYASKIVTIGSAAGRRADPRSPIPYAAAKAGIALLTQDVAAQAGPFGIRVNCITPETILTEGNQDRIPAELQASLADAHPPRRPRPAGTGHRSRRARAAARRDRRKEPAGGQVHPHPAPPRRAPRPRRPRRRAAARLLHRALAPRGAGVTLKSPSGPCG